MVFDPDAIIDRAQYTDPHHYAEGVVHVLVNGTFVLRAGVMTGALPGRFLPRMRPSAKPAGRASVGSPAAAPRSAATR